jgi:3'-phosphoadenosine 5'-phosphosulfate sulfotransferase (PAPS reductase)/FAD synthetase
MLFASPREVATDEAVMKAIADQAVIVINLSGGKDSTVAGHSVMALLDAHGHPREKRIAIHADLGRAEWRSTASVVEAVSSKLGLELLVVRRGAGDMVARWEVRFSNALARYAALETYNLIGPWSQANKRFCTAELKAQVIGPELARRYRGQQVVQVIGIRREESTGRSKTPISAPDTRFAKPGNKHGTSMMMWNPLIHWPVDDVFACHQENELPLHEAYTEYGSSRLSCAFCVLASIRDLRAAASAAGNVELYLHLVGMEASSTFSFQPERWLGDVAPALLSPGLAADLERAKVDAARRREIEAAMPEGLRYVKGWPVRVPTWEEAAAIVTARSEILRRHGQEDRYSSPRLVVDRFEELLALKAGKQAA